MDETGITVDPTASGVAVVWLDREERGNAFTAAMLERLQQVLEELDEDDEVRCIVVTGRGRYFSTGADLESPLLSPTPDDVTARRRQTMGGRLRPWSMRTPIVGALNGAAVGVGMTLAVQWDIRVVSANAKYGFVFNRRGVIPEMNSLWLLPRLIGLSRAVELLLTGRLFTGTEALDLGLATRAVEADAVLQVARQLAEDIAANTAPVSTTITKRLVYQALGETDPERAFNEEWELFQWMTQQPDSAEGIRSFLEKRSPRWTSTKTEPIPAVELTWPSGPVRPTRAPTPPAAPTAHDATGGTVPAG
jgi:enoyl-CoA hydratase/carnithine racemase